MRFLFLLFFLLSNGVILANKIDSIHSKLRADSLEHVIERYESRNQILEERLDQASDTIAGQSSLLGGFGIIYTIITMIIAVLAIALPILNYQFGIKPSREALKEIQSGLDKKFSEFLSQSRETQVDDSITKLADADYTVRQMASSYLSLTQHLGFSEYQLFRLYGFVKKGELDLNTKSLIANFLTSKETSFATSFFIEEMRSQSMDMKHYALKYFIVAGGIARHMDHIVEYVSQSPHKDVAYNGLIANVVSFDVESVLILLNNKELVNVLGEEDLKELRKTSFLYPKIWRIPEEKLEQTYLYKRMNSI